MTEKINLNQIRVIAGPSPADDAVAELADSIGKIGMHTPVAVLANGDVFILQAGRTRFAAHRKLGRDKIEAEVFTDALNASLWAVAENLHRKDLSVIERAKLHGEWKKLMAEKEKRDNPQGDGAGEVSSQVGTKPRPRSERGKVGQGTGGGRPTGGTNAVAREVNISKTQAHRSTKIAALPPEVQAQAKAMGLDNNQRALLAAANQESTKAQIATLQEYAAAKRRKTEIKNAPPPADGRAYPTAFQMFKAWYEQQHSATRKQIIEWLQTVNTADLIAQLTQGILDGTDPIGSSVH